MAECKKELMEAGKSYPRTCQLCRLGSCHRKSDFDLALVRKERDELRGAIAKLMKGIGVVGISQSADDVVEQTLKMLSSATKAKRVWINQPSALQPHHKWHGTNGYHLGDRFYFLEGAVISMRVTESSLSSGWTK